MDLKQHIREVPDFPKPGINFYDITTLLKHPEALRVSLDRFGGLFSDLPVEKVVGVESRGFLFGMHLAYQLGAGFIPVRKAGKLPADTHFAEYDLEYGTDKLEMHRDAVAPGDRVLVIDDVVATGGTAQATAQLIESSGGAIAGFGFLLELSFLDGRGRLDRYDVRSLIQY